MATGGWVVAPIVSKLIDRIAPILGVRPNNLDTRNLNLENIRYVIGRLLFDMLFRELIYRNKKLIKFSIRSKINFMSFKSKEFQNNSKKIKEKLYICCY